MIRKYCPDCGEELVLDDSGYECYDCNKVFPEIEIEYTNFDFIEHLSEDEFAKLVLKLSEEANKSDNPEQWIAEWANKQFIYNYDTWFTIDKTFVKLFETI